MSFGPEDLKGSSRQGTRIDDHLDAGIRKPSFVDTEKNKEKAREAI